MAHPGDIVVASAARKNPSEGCSRLFLRGTAAIVLFHVFFAGVLFLLDKDLIRRTKEKPCNVCNTDGYHPYRAVHTSPLADRNADHPLLGSTADWGCFRLVTTRNRSVTVDFDGGCYRAVRKKKREKNKENLESDAALPILIRHLRAISSPRAGFLPTRGEESSTHVGRRNEVTLPFF
ncbi:hypothetical protein B296_00044977 [Ensete ventricosum]|uniref:Uncharacterized protein n=1 Tax=Ensete ventricosum TaxID=4639 RepID=A0A426YK32_ENSVE|nr:hypothetical protein B296_00044977 [Ensete ventricosum]